MVAKYRLAALPRVAKPNVGCIVKFTFLQMLFSGDNSGAIRVWETQQSGEDLDSSMASRQNALFWFLKRKLDFKVRPMSFSLKGVAMHLKISFATHRNWATIRSPI